MTTPAEHTESGPSHRRDSGLDLGWFGLMCLAAGLAAGVTLLAWRLRLADLPTEHTDYGADSLTWRRTRA